MNKKFKLLKQWPDAEIGDLYQWNGQGYSNQSRTAMVVSKTYVEQYPEWFEEIPGKGLSEEEYTQKLKDRSRKVDKPVVARDGEIVEIILTHPENGRLLYIKQSDGGFMREGYFDLGLSFTEDDLLASIYTPAIQAVKRISDNEVFSVGDRCYYSFHDGSKGATFTIASFEIEKSNTILIRDELRTPKTRNLQTLHHAPPQESKQSVDREWEIVSFYDGCINGHTDPRTLTKCHKNIHDKIIELGFTIHSVKRLSDSLVISIGDVGLFMEGCIEEGVVQKFEVTNDELKVFVSWGNKNRYTKCLSLKDIYIQSSPPQQSKQEWWQKLGIKFDGKWYSHPKTNTYDNLEQVMQELYVRKQEPVVPPVVRGECRETESGATGLYTKEQQDYVNSIKDEDLRSHLLHQVRLRDNMEHDRDNFEKMLAKAQLKDKIIIDLEEMRNDKSEGSYYYSWQANIAMQFKDEYERLNPNMRDGNKEILHNIANNAAKKFLDLLICQPKSEPAPQQPERIEVDEIQRHTIASQGLYCYKFYTSHNLSRHKYKFPAIKQAIEDVLNEPEVKPFCQKEFDVAMKEAGSFFKNSHYLTTAQLNEEREKAFIAGRQKTSGRILIDQHLQYTRFQDYLNSIK